MPDAGELDDDETYSEVSTQHLFTGRKMSLSANITKMWMGTYPTVPSQVRATGGSLLEHLKKNPDLVGESVCRRYGPDIPFLPKVR